MTSNLFRLIRIHFTSLWQSSQSKRRRKHSNKAMTAAKIILAYLFALIVIGYYVGMTMSVYFSLGQPQYVIPMAFLATCAFIFFTTVFRVGQFLITCKDNDLVFSLPLPKSIIVLSRYIALYLFELTLSVMIIGTAYGFYVYHMGFTAGMLVYALIGIFLAPLFPLLLSAIFGVLLTTLTSKLPLKRFFQFVLYIAFIGAVFYISFRSSSGNGAQTAMQATGIADRFSYIMYPLHLYTEGDPLSLVLYVAASILSAVLTVALLTKYFFTLNKMMTGQRLKGNFKLRTLHAGSLSGALLRKEFQRFTSSTLYMLNASINLLILLIVSVAVFFIKEIDLLLEIPPAIDMIFPILPLAISFMIVSAGSASSSLSLEGKNIWLPASLPVTSAQVFHAKLKLHLLLELPIVLISAILITIRFRVTGVYLVTLFLLPLLFALTTAVVGLALNIRFPNFTWTNETAVIKQSAPVLITVLSGMALSILPILGMTLLELPPLPIEFGLCALLGCIDLLCYIYIRKTDLNQFC